jgi:hypothetical protein
MKATDFAMLAILEHIATCWRAEAGKLLPLLDEGVAAWKPTPKKFEN